MSHDEVAQGSCIHRFQERKDCLSLLGCAEEPRRSNLVSVTGWLELLLPKANPVIELTSRSPQALGLEPLAFLRFRGIFALSRIGLVAQAHLPSVSRHHNDIVLRGHVQVAD